MRVLAALHRLHQSKWWSLFLRPLLYLVLALLIGRILVSLVGAVNWRDVGTALGKLSWRQAPVLIALLLVRQALNSIPLAVFVPGLGFKRAFQNDLTANLVGTMAPPPGDVVIRVSMFRSWEISPLDGMPGVTLNTLTFYVIRFGIPVVGLLLLIGEDLSKGQIWSAIISFVIAIVIVVALVLISRGELLARRLGQQAARIASRFKEGVDPAVWAEAVATFRERMSSRLVRGLPPSLTALAAMVLTDGLIVVFALRFTGVGSSFLAIMFVLASFFIAYPLTALPLAGLGVLDAALVVTFTEVAGVAKEAEIVAALVVWRVVTLIGTLLLGGLTFGWWHLQMHRGRLAPSAPASDPA